MKVVYTPAHLRHDPRVEMETTGPHSPFEHIGRAEAIRSALAADPNFDLVTPTEWGLDPIAAVHDPGLVHFLEHAWAQYQLVEPGTREVVPDVFAHARFRDKLTPGDEPTSIRARLGWWCFEITTPLTEGTFEAARGAVDTALTATQSVLDGEPVAYALCRPPGHHATTSLYGGYCFFNNAAVAAHHVAATTGGKVSVVDVDYHHGNGTQQIFYDRDDVQYVSLHADPHRAYPYSTGYVDETGSGRGRGANVNVPLRAHTDDDAYLAALAGACEQVAAFGPDLLIVSLGLDTFVSDPISDLALTADGFERCGALMRDLGIPMVVVQEGGYDVAALGDNVRRWLVGAGG